MTTDETPNTQKCPFDEIAEARASEPAVIYARDRQTKFGLIDLQEFVHFDITNEDDLYAAQQIELLHEELERHEKAVVFGDDTALDRTPEAKLQGFLLSKFEAFSRAVLTPMAFDDETMEALHDLAEEHGIKFEEDEQSDHIVDANKKPQPAPKLNQRQPERGETVWLPFRFVKDDGGDLFPWEMDQKSDGTRRCLDRPDRWHVGENLPMAPFPPVRVGDIYRFENGASDDLFRVREIDLSSVDPVGIEFSTEQGKTVFGRLSLDQITNCELIQRASTEEASE